MSHMSFCIKAFLSFGIPAGHAFWTSVGSIARVDGISMQPTFNPDPIGNDWVYFDRRRKYDVSPGDIAIIISPTDPEEKIVKRVIAVNGIIRSTYPEPREVSIPPGHIWVEGDNSKNSIDSNYYGPIPVGLVLGKVTWIIWPFKRVQALESKLIRQL